MSALQVVSRLTKPAALSPSDEARCSAAAAAGASEAAWWWGTTRGDMVRIVYADPYPEGQQWWEPEPLLGGGERAPLSDEQVARWSVAHPDPTH